MDLKISREVRNRREEGTALGNLGILHKQRGELNTAIECYRLQLELARDTSDRGSEGRALWNLSLLLEKVGNRIQAMRHADRALRIFELIESPDQWMVRRALALWSV